METEKQVDTYRIVANEVASGAAVAGVVAERLKPKETAKHIKREVGFRIFKHFARYGRKLKLT